MKPPSPAESALDSANLSSVLLGSYSASPALTDGTDGVSSSDHRMGPASPAASNVSHRFQALLFNFVIPFAILAVGASVIGILGTVEPKTRPADDQSLAGRMKRLPGASVERVLSLAELNQPLELRVDGVVVPYREVQLAAEVAGRITRKSPSCEAGSFVKKGDWLVDVDDTDYQQEVDRLTRMREQDYEAIKEVDQEMENARRLVKVANDDVALQEREVKRMEAMPEGFASQVELDQAQKGLLAATQNRIGFENQLNLLAARRSKLEAAERLATTQLRGAEVNLKRSRIYSPIDGIVIQENAELNSFIQRGSPIITLEDVSKAEIAVNLRMDQLHWVLDQRRSTDALPGDNADSVEAEVSNATTQVLPSDGLTSTDVNTDATAALEKEIQSGSDDRRAGYLLPPTPAIVEFEVSGLSGKKFSWDGTLVRYDGIGLDAQSRTVPVVVVVDQPSKFSGGDKAIADATSVSPLVRGMFVSVRLLIRPTTPLVAIPSLAMQPGNRIWHFIPDDSVLNSEFENTPDAGTVAGDATPVNTSADAGTSSESSQSGVGTASSDKKRDFDPIAWKAGRVVVRSGVVPVDSLWLPASDSDVVADEFATRRKDTLSDRRYWICEMTQQDDVQGVLYGGDSVADNTLNGGDFVVVTPLGDFGTTSPSVRVPAAALKQQGK